MVPQKVLWYHKENLLRQNTKKCENKNLTYFISLSGIGTGRVKMVMLLEVYSEPNQTLKMEFIAKIVNS